MSADAPNELAMRRAGYRLDAEDAEMRDDPEGLSMPLRQLREKALDDLKARRPGAVTDWIFLHAQAKGEEAAASRALKRLEDQEMLLHARASGMTSDAAIALVMEHAIGPAGFKVVETRYSDAVARVVATERVIGLLQARPPAAPAATTGKRP